MSPPVFASRGDYLSWGRVQRRPQKVAAPLFRDQLQSFVKAGAPLGMLAVGLRRSYGDSCLNSDGIILDMSRLDRFIVFDESTGTLRAEAGASLAEILRLVVPGGWFLPTTPGTRFVTLGGAVANDVHGKNHHRAGSFGCHVNSFGLLRSDGSRRVVTRDTEPNLFAATIGGLGLTGVIEWVEIQLAKIGSAYLDVETVPFNNLRAFWTLAEESADTFEHTVSWIDCSARGANFGRGVFSRANWRDDGVFAPRSDNGFKSIPFDLPGIVLNRFSVSAFNELYWHANRAKAGSRRQHYAPFFYPLDAIQKWNRLYGRRGMYQYQCVIPPENSQAAISCMLKEITAAQEASFLAVLKTFGRRPSPGLLSFPRPGTTLALDFSNRGAKTLSLLARLDFIVREAKGALYPAKDGRVPRGLFEGCFPRLQTFLEHKDSGMNSDFWRRVGR